MEMIFQENILLSILSIIQTGYTNLKFTYFFRYTKIQSKTEICIYVVQQNIAQMQITHSRNRFSKKKCKVHFYFEPLQLGPNWMDKKYSDKKIPVGKIVWIGK